MKMVYDCLSDRFHLQPLTKMGTLSSFLVYWMSVYPRHSECSYLPFFIIWCIWKWRNHCLFEGKKPSILGMLHQIEYYTQLYPVSSVKIKKSRICGPGPSLVFPYGFFDGATADYKGGVGFSLVLNESHSFEFVMGADFCTNTKVELMAL